jgi:hypothetical protein
MLMKKLLAPGAAFAQPRPMLPVEWMHLQAEKLREVQAAPVLHRMAVRRSSK